ncbi:6-bladed beta-propeller, partial [bacterium]|nr:6-bladed beta-propeller [bacterium]
MTQKQSRLILLCTGLVVLNVIIFLMARYRSSNPSPQPNNSMPTYGEDLNERLQRAGLTIKHGDASFGLLLFLGDSLTGEIGQLQDELRLLKSQDVDVVIITRTEKHLQQKGITEKVGARIIPDSLGTKFRAIGLSEHLGQILLYDTESFQTIAASSPFNKFETVKEALLKAGFHPLVRVKPTAYKESELSDMGRKFAHFPFDSLINHAKEVPIDLDNLPYENLTLERMVGNQESESAGEPMFSRPWAIARDSKNRVFVVDGSANQVFVLNENGALISRFGRKGEGPGEFCSPTEIAIHNDRIFIADACLKVHEFDMSFQVVNTFRHDSETSPSTGIGSIGGILFIPTFPLPPKRTKLIQIFEMREGKLYFINSFYNYIQPGKKYSSQTGAIFSLNQIRFVTDGRRYLAFGRRSENNLFLIDMKTRVSY